MALEGSGFDSPVARLGQDLLGRRGFAEEIYRIATTTPADWSVRVGVYGEWGTGKTSVLNFVAEMAKDDGHVVSWFNPWEFETQDELWHGFVECIYEGVMRSGKGIPSKWYPIKRFFNLGVGLAKLLASMREESKKIAETGLPYLKQWLRFTESDLQEIIKALNGKRFIILIDDLDRTDPRLVGKILFALRQLLDTPGFSYVLAFDPHKVGEALKETMAGLETGSEFLDKIIDFPRNLPEPSDDTVRNLAISDIKGYCQFIDAEGVLQALRFLPRNPRTLRQFVRHLWCLESVVKRHGPSEIDWHTLALVTLLKIQCPAVAREVLSSADCLKSLGQESFHWSSLKVDEETTSDNAADVMISQLFKAHGINEGSQGRLRELLFAMGGRIFPVGTEGLQYLAYLSERPCALTDQEFDDFYSHWQKVPEWKTVEDWIGRHSQDHRLQAADISRGVFARALVRRQRALSSAADARIEAEMLPRLSEANELLALLEMFAMPHESVGTIPNLDVEQFESLLKHVEKWVGFDNNELYKKLRAQEATLMTRIADKFCEPGNALRLLTPWNPGFRRNLMNSKQAEPLYEAMSTVLYPTVADTLILRAQRPDGMRELWQLGDHAGDVFVLLDPHGSLWNDSTRKLKLLAIFKEAVTNREVQLNAIELLTLIGFTLTKGDVPKFRENAKDLLKDTEIITAIWIGATAHKLNPRTWGSLVQARNQFATVAGVQLPDPTWASDFPDSRQESE